MACPMWASFCTGKSTVFITRVTTRLPSAGPACMWLRPPCTTRRGWCPSWSPGCTPWLPWPGSSIAQWGPGSDTTGFRYVAKALPRTVQKQPSHERHESCLMFNFTVAGKWGLLSSPAPQTLRLQLRGPARTHGSVIWHFCCW